MDIKETPSWLDLHFSTFERVAADLVPWVSDPESTEKLHTGGACDRTTIEEDIKVPTTIRKFENKADVLLLHRDGDTVPVSKTGNVQYDSKMRRFFSLGMGKHIKILCPEWINPIPDVHCLKIRAQLVHRHYKSEVRAIVSIESVKTVPPTPAIVQQLLRMVFGKMPPNLVLSKKNNGKHAFDLPMYAPENPWYCDYHATIIALQNCDKQQPLPVKNSIVPLPRALVFACHKDVIVYYAFVQIHWLHYFYDIDWLLGLGIDDLYQMYDMLQCRNPIETPLEQGVWRAFFYTCFDPTHEWSIALAGPDAPNMEAISMKRNERDASYKLTCARRELCFTHAVRLNSEAIVDKEFVQHILVYEVIKTACRKYGHRYVLFRDLRRLMAWICGEKVEVSDMVPSIVMFHSTTARNYRKSTLGMLKLPNIPLMDSIRFLERVGVIVTDGFGVQLLLHAMHDICITNSVKTMMRRHQPENHLPLDGILREWRGVWALEDAALDMTGLCSEQLAGLLALRTSPIVVCSGRAGSGKSNLGSAFFRMMSPGTIIGVAFQGSHASTLARKIRQCGVEAVPVSTVHNLLYWHEQCCPTGNGCMLSKSAVKLLADRNSILSTCMEYGAYDAQKCLLANVSIVVIDEGGVLYEELFAALMMMLIRCCPNLRALVILQDPNQLPPISGGRLGVDLAMGIGIVPMHHCHRQTNQLLKKLHDCILKGKTPPSMLLNNSDGTCRYLECASARYNTNDVDRESAWYIFRDAITKDPIRSWIGCPFSALPVTRTNRERKALNQAFASVLYADHMQWKSSENTFESIVVQHVMSNGPSVIRNTISRPLDILERDGVIKNKVFYDTFHEGMIISSKANDPQLGIATGERMVVLGIEHGHVLNIGPYFMSEIIRKLNWSIWDASCEIEDLNDMEQCGAASKKLKQSITDAMFLHRNNQAMMGYQVAKFVARKWNTHEVSKWLNSDAFVHSILTPGIYGPRPASPRVQSEILEFIVDRIIEQHRCTKEIAEGLAASIMRDIVVPALPFDEEEDEAIVAKMPSNRAMSLIVRDSYTANKKGGYGSANIRNQNLHFFCDELWTICAKDGKEFVQTGVKRERQSNQDSGSSSRQSGVNGMLIECSFLVCCSVEQYMSMRENGTVPTGVVRIPCTTSCTKSIDNGGVITFYSAQSHEDKTVIIIMHSPATRADFYTAITRGRDGVLIISNMYAIEKTLENANCVRQSSLVCKIAETVRINKKTDDDMDEFVRRADACIVARHLPEDTGRTITSKITQNGERPDIFPATLKWAEDRMQMSATN